MFHAKEGFGFERVGDGAVRITHRRKVMVDGVEREAIDETTMDAASFASMVAEVSALGANSDRQGAALEFHMSTARGEG